MLAGAWGWDPRGRTAALDTRQKPLHKFRLQKPSAGQGGCEWALRLWVGPGVWSGSALFFLCGLHKLLDLSVLLPLHVLQEGVVVAALRLSRCGLVWAVGALTHLHVVLENVSPFPLLITGVVHAHLEDPAG